MNANKLILLSGELKNTLLNIIKKHECQIAQDLLNADALISTSIEINDEMEWRYYDDCKKLTAKIVTEHLDKMVSEYINDEARMLSIRFNSFEISYLPKGKSPMYVSDKIWSRQNRQSAKPARIIQKLLVKKYSCKDFENFNNWLKAEILNIGTFELLKGPDITKYYLEDNYYVSKGSLGNSCMRHQECQKYFGVYEDYASMLVLFKGNKILGRAIVWEIDDKVYMDRIYTCEDYLVSNFINYAESNNWYHRDTLDYLCDGDFPGWVGPETNYQKSIYPILEITLNQKYDYMPYMDSFRYYDELTNTISTNPNFGTICLSETDGTYEPEYEIYTCQECGYEERVLEGDDLENLVYSSYQNAYYCPECRKYCSGIDDYVSKSTTIIKVYDISGECEDYPLSYVCNDSKFVKINDKWYFKCDCIKDLDGNYKLKDE